MTYRCFYCDYDVDPEDVHFVTFKIMEQEREEPLCKHCYGEWLEGIKE
ncbi:hypothetical protein CathTA2_1760 [Caldalkalibacillus thermarum TA2.A1]|uniref:Uncharacterized protein n=1 Tax=Caldalkalibacillus thermarum (strain TA2.A1) TaxID=986075 RepID=F5L7G0_CALTT|nr:hypothetical protein [Caldalkalibacillus thermarum]EGL82752.1 hypothetical protein CathTA2_1760 [Caldalkalibacillus thermarum TA2.A1]QZT32550.1 hypothetical protein HUR95_09030 [Caldalkalibacillus thermarum TA2.A1]